MEQAEEIAFEHFEAIHRVVLWSFAYPPYSNPNSKFFVTSDKSRQDVCASLFQFCQGLEFHVAAYLWMTRLHLIDSSGFSRDSGVGGCREGKSGSKDAGFQQHYLLCWRCRCHC